MTTIIKGNDFASDLRGQIHRQTALLQENYGITPGLAVVLVGTDPASEIYVRNKTKQAIAAGMASFEHRLAASTSQQELLALLARLNENPAINGILVQLPLPARINPDSVINAIDPSKDVDGFHPVNVGLLVTGDNAMIPCTPLGCLMLLRHALGQQQQALAGLKALVLGRSNIVGKPMGALLVRESCTVTLAHSQTRNLADECRQADILIAAAGRPGLVKGDWIKPGATVIDVGINRIITATGRTRLVGDVDFDSALGIAGAMTPVPGGVGPMTIACLLHNTLKATLKQQGIPASNGILGP